LTSALHRLQPALRGLKSVHLSNNPIPHALVTTDSATIHVLALILLSVFISVGCADTEGLCYDFRSADSYDG
jgi:hypothetical protein